DLQSVTTQLVDADTNGAALTDHYGVIPALSADGRFVAFHTSDGGMAAGDLNGSADVFVRDTLGGTNELISQRNSLVNLTVGRGVTSLSQPSISADGTRVVFASLADDLVPNDRNGASDV